MKGKAVEKAAGTSLEWQGRGLKIMKIYAFLGYRQGVTLLFS
jgi:hypothetical protein